jgi:hypothetical protein
MSITNDRRQESLRHIALLELVRETLPSPSVQALLLLRIVRSSCIGCASFTAVFLHNGSGQRLSELQ